MYIVMKPDELVHYGVRGMKWGIRNDRVISLGKKTKKTTRSAINKYRNLTGSHRSSALKKYRNKNIDGMSDKDLQSAVNRMRLEQQYRDLTKVQFRRGQSAVNQMYGATNAMNRTISSAKKAKSATFTAGAKAAAKLAAA